MFQGVTGVWLLTRSDVNFKEVKSPEKMIEDQLKCLKQLKHLLRQFLLCIDQNIETPEPFADI